MTYEHTQRGQLMLVIMAACVVFFGYLFFTTETEPVVGLVMLFILFMLGSFASLTVTVDPTDIRVKFGYGLYRFQLALQDIAEVRAVKNHWYFGWGIRYWFWPRMWIYNVSGFDAVELKTKDGRIYRIGTDDPANLEQAIRMALSQTGQIQGGYSGV
jgi:hypothetical protein